MLYRVHGNRIRVDMVKLKFDEPTSVSDKVRIDLRLIDTSVQVSLVWLGGLRNTSEFARICVAVSLQYGSSVRLAGFPPSFRPLEKVCEPMKLVKRTSQS